MDAVTGVVLTLAYIHRKSEGTISAIIKFVNSMLLTVNAAVEAL